MDRPPLPDSAPTRLLLVDEDPCFVAPQGEGKFMGRLSVFLRCSTCNLRCAWANDDGSVTLCDTAYSSHLPSVQRWTPGRALERLRNAGPAHVVLTGGEPTRQPALLGLIDPLEAAGKCVTVETNGTRFFASRATLVSLSPKTAASTRGLERLADPTWSGTDTDGFLAAHDLENARRVAHFRPQVEAHERQRYAREVLARFLADYGPDRLQFKFVAHEPADIAEINERYVTPLKLPPEIVYLMPQGTCHAQLQERAAWVVEQCCRHGFNYSDRLHLRIHGNRPGV